MDRNYAEEIKDWVNGIEGGDITIMDIDDVDFMEYLNFMAGKVDEATAEDIASYVEALEEEALFVGDVGDDNFVEWAEKAKIV